MRKHPRNEEIFYNNLFKLITSLNSQINKLDVYREDYRKRTEEKRRLSSFTEYLLEDMERTKHLLEIYDKGDEQDKWDGSLHLCFRWESEIDVSSMDSSIRSYIKSCLINGSFGSVETGESIEMDFRGIPIKVFFEISE